MIKAFFGNVADGRLLRLPYLGYVLLINLIIVCAVFATIAAIGAGEHLIGGNLQQAQNMLREWFTLPFFIVFGLGTLFYFFAIFNLMAKRLRDIGIPGWWAVLAVIILELVISYTISQQASNGVNTLIGIALLLIPSNFLNSKLN
ncbi:MAG TPA: DUF805 domain-containing protein [Methylophaga sp.]|nr:DUF805 domain-containing protein [Methylophaga sp.]